MQASVQARARAAAIALLVATVVVAGCGSSSKGTATRTSKGTGASPATPVATPAATAGGDHIEIQAGINDPGDPNVTVTEFLPATVTVVTGTRVRWSWGGAIEPHSVTFFPPGRTPPPPGSDTALFFPTPATGPYDGATLVNSGLAPIPGTPTPPAPFDVTFAKPGTYTYHCVIHPNMTGTVVVAPPGGAVDTPAAVNARGAKELGQWLAEGRAAKHTLETTPPQRTTNTDGTTTWRVHTGVTTEHTDALAFGPGDTRLKAGDRVTFVNESQAPHTVTFPGTESAPPKNALDPREGQVTPGPSPQTIDPTRLFNTGELPPDAPPGGGPPEAARSFTFVVPAAGKYSFYCILHVTSGMGGTLTAG